MMTTDSSRPLPAPSTLLSPAFAPFAEQNPFPLFLPPFWNYHGTYWMNGNGRGEGVLSERMLLTQNYVIRPSPLIPTSHGPG